MHRDVRDTGHSAISISSQQPLRMQPRVNPAHPPYRGFSCRTPRFTKSAQQISGGKHQTRSTPGYAPMRKQRQSTPTCGCMQTSIEYRLCATIPCLFYVQMHACCRFHVKNTETWMNRTWICSLFSPSITLCHLFQYPRYCATCYVHNS